METQLQEQSQAKINIGSATATNDQHSRGDMVGTSCLVTSVGLRIAEYFCECGWFYSLGQQFYLLFPSNWEHGQILLAALPVVQSINVIVGFSCM